MRPCGMNLLRKIHAGTANGALCRIARHRNAPATAGVCHHGLRGLGRDFTGAIGR